MNSYPNLCKVPHNFFIISSLVYFHTKQRLALAAQMIKQSTFEQRITRMEESSLEKLKGDDLI